MPDPHAFNLDFQPPSYWDLVSLPVSTCSVTEGKAKPPSDTLGGDYLPPLEADEVEIARVELQSTGSDVISIRARRLKSCISYQIVDEHEGILVKYKVIPNKSEQALTLGQLVKMIENALPGGIIGNFRKMVYHSNPENVYNYGIASSLFYPELEKYFRQANKEWLDRELKKRGKGGVVYVTSGGIPVYEGPMSYAEEMAFYRSVDGNGRGPVATTTTHTRVASSSQAKAAAAGAAARRRQSRDPQKT